MTTKEIDELIEETKKLSRASDKAQLNTALGILEVARQLAILNSTLAGSSEKPKAMKAAAGKRK